MAIDGVKEPHVGHGRGADDITSGQDPKWVGEAVKVMQGSPGAD